MHRRADDAGDRGRKPALGAPAPRQAFPRSGADGARWGRSSAKGLFFFEDLRHGPAGASRSAASSLPPARSAMRATFPTGPPGLSGGPLPPAHPPPPHSTPLDPAAGPSGHDPHEVRPSAAGFEPGIVQPTESIDIIACFRPSAPKKICTGNLRAMTRSDMAADRIWIASRRRAPSPPTLPAGPQSQILSRLRASHGHLKPVTEDSAFGASSGAFGEPEPAPETCTTNPSHQPVSSGLPGSI